MFDTHKYDFLLVQKEEVSNLYIFDIYLMHNSHALAPYWLIRGLHGGANSAPK